MARLLAREPCVAEVLRSRRHRVSYESLLEMHGSPGRTPLLFLLAACRRGFCEPQLPRATTTYLRDSRRQSSTSRRKSPEKPVKPSVDHTLGTKNNYAITQKA